MTSGWAQGYRMQPATSYVCARCGESKPTESFRILRRGSHASYCTECAIRLTREWRADHRESYNARTRARYAAEMAARRAARVPIVKRCSVCAAEFEAPHPSYLRCDAHRSPKRPRKSA